MLLAVGAAAAYWPNSTGRRVGSHHFVTTRVSLWRPPSFNFETFVSQDQFLYGHVGALGIEIVKSIAERPGTKQFPRKYHGGEVLRLERYRDIAPSVDVAVADVIDPGVKAKGSREASTKNH